MLAWIACAMIGRGALAAPPTTPAPEPDPWAHEEIQLTYPPRQPAEPTRRSLVGFGLGPTYFGVPATRGSRAVNHVGLALVLHWRRPLGDHFGVDLGATWGFTTFERTTDVARGAYRFADETLDIVGTGYRHVGDEGSLWVVPRALLYTVLLVLGLLTSALGFVISPFASTTYVQADASASYDFGANGRDGLFAKTGAAVFVDPRSGRGFVGTGPKLGFGYRAP